jgi:hypothetical protein
MAQPGQEGAGGGGGGDLEALMDGWRLVGNGTWVAERAFGIGGTFDIMLFGYFDEGRETAMVCVCHADTFDRPLFYEAQTLAEVSECPCLDSLEQRSWYAQCTMEPVSE